jgi:hypothetical protein
MAEFIGADVTGLAGIQEKLDKLYPYAADMGVEAADEKVIELVSKEARPAYAQEPFFWSSDKQRKAYFASNGFGAGIPYVRTHQLRDGWQTLGYGRTQIVVNEVPYAGYVKQMATQIIGMKFRDWDVMEQELEQGMGKIINAFEEAVKQAISDLGLD